MYELGIVICVIALGGVLAVGQQPAVEALTGKIYMYICITYHYIAIRWLPRMLQYCFLDFWQEMQRKERGWGTLL